MVCLDVIAARSSRHCRRGGWGGYSGIGALMAGRHLPPNMHCRLRCCKELGRGAWV